MARPISEEELQLKKRARRRLVGAIVLVSVVAVVLPMVLDSEPKQPSQKVDIQIPPSDSGEFKPQAPGASAAKAVPQPAARSDVEIKPETPPKLETTAKADAPGQRETSAKGETPPAAKSEAAATDRTPAAAVADAESKPAASPAAADRPKEPATPKAVAKNAASAKSASGAYVVQVAALADPDKAKELEKRMASTGVKTYTEVVTTSTGEVTRVRAGPYATKDAAEKARAQLKKAGLEGKIVPK